MYIVYWIYNIPCNIDGRKSDIIKGWKIFDTLDQAKTYAEELPDKYEWSIAKDIPSIPTDI